MARFLISAALLGLSAQLVSAQTTCGIGNLCPADSPCCSQYGECGTGTYCLGGCDPLSSFSTDSCVPQPVCENRDIKFTDTKRMQDYSTWLGDPTDVDFVYSGEPRIYNDQVLLTMTEGSSGTLLASTTYVWYGKVTAKLKSSGGNGVVSAFILLSDTKDEIDYEFVGYDLSQVQTNYYFEAIPNYTNGGNSSIPGGNSMTTEHTYAIDWKPDAITWYIDDNPVRTLERSSTWNASANQWNYPQTPARVQLSIWPAGDSAAQGTSSWAGGKIDWSSSDMVNGYYYAAFSEINIECYSPPTGANATGNNSYVYNGRTGLNNTVAVTDEKTILKSLLGTGTNMSANYPSSASASAAAAASSNAPGLSGGGADGSRGSGSSGSSSSSGSSGTSSSTASAATGFVQGGGSTGNAGASLAVNDRMLQGSLMAAVIVLAGMITL